jgi:hypothetical protein
MAISQATGLTDINSSDDDWRNSYMLLGGGVGGQIAPHGNMLPNYSPIAPPYSPIAPTAQAPTSTQRPLIRTGAENFAGRGGDWNALYGPKPAATAASPGIPDLSGIGNLGNALNTAGNVNQFNLDYYRGAEQSDPIFSAAQKLLNPNDSQANYDVNMHGAELATARGVPGSGLAGETTGRIRQADIERRAGLANQLLSGAHSRVPQPFDIGSQLLSAVQAGQLSMAQAQLALQREVELGRLDLQRAQYYNGLLRGYGTGGSGGGNRNMPLPGAGGGAPSENPRTGPAFQSNPFWDNPLSGITAGPRGATSFTAPPPINAPENWDLLTPQEQAQYAEQYRSNPGNYGSNPWEGDEGNWDIGSGDWTLGSDWYDEG